MAFLFFWDISCKYCVYSCDASFRVLKLHEKVGLTRIFKTFFFQKLNLLSNFRISIEYFLKSLKYNYVIVRSEKKYLRIKIFFSSAYQTKTEINDAENIERMIKRFKISK